MFEKISKKKLTGVILAGVLTVAGATSAFAADLPNSKEPVKSDKTIKSARYEQFHKIDVSKMSTAIKSAIDGLVSAGTITQAQADAVIKVYTPGVGKEMRQIILKKNPMDELVTAGTITQTQADAIDSAMKTIKESKKTAEDVMKELVSAGKITQAQSDVVLKGFTPGDRKFDDIKFSKNPLNELLTSGTLTQTQMDAINKAIKTGIESKKTMEDIFKGLVTDGTITEAQKEAVQKIFPNKGILARPIIDRKNPIDSLVTSGTITQAQADAIHDALKAGKDSVKSMKEAFDGLVAAGTVTQAQEDIILKAFPLKGEKFINKSELKGFEGKGLTMKLRNNPLDELISAGTITQAQADAINIAIKSALSSLGE